MVALFNGVGGGAVALIALSEYYDWTHHNIGVTTDVEIASVLSLIIGSISFWGSVIAFLKLSERMTGRSVKFPGQSIVNSVVGLGVLAAVGYMLSTTGMD